MSKNLVATALTAGKSLLQRRISQNLVMPTIDSLNAGDSRRFLTTAPSTQFKDFKPKEDTRITVTMHPVTNIPFNDLKKSGDTYVTKELWHEIINAFDSYKELLKNFQGKNVTLRSWKHGDRDRHPHEQLGISTLGSIIEKISILDALGVEINDNLQANVMRCVDELLERFDTRKKGKSDYHEVTAKYEDSLNELNELWKENMALVRTIHAGSDYRVSSSDLESVESQQKIIDTLAEMKESNADITRLIIADCENVEQVRTAKLLAANSGLNLEIMPLFEDRMPKDTLMEIIEEIAEGKSKINVMIAGSDSDRRIHKVGVINLVININDCIKEYLEKNPGQITEVNFFTGTGNSVYRTQKLSHFIPTLIVDGNNIMAVETTVQGQSFHALKDVELSGVYLEEHQKGLENRPTQNDVALARGIFSTFDQIQKEHLQTHGNDPILRADMIAKILPNSRGFGSRSKEVIFDSETISQNDLLNKTRAIDHAWIWQITRVVPTGVKEFHHIVSTEQELLLENKYNPYVKKLVQDIYQMSYYCNEEIAKDYYCNEETLRSDFGKLAEVKDFVKINFPEIHQEIIDSMKHEYKHYNIKNAQFEEYFEEFTQYCRDLSALSKSAIELDKKNSQEQLKSEDKSQIKNPFNHEITKLNARYYGETSRLHKNSGRNFSTTPERDQPDTKVALSTGIGLALGVSKDSSRIS